MRTRLTGLVLATVLLGRAAQAAPEVLPQVAPTMAELQKIEAASYRGTVDTLRMKYQEVARARPGDAMPRVFVAWCTLPSDDAWNQLKAIATIFPDNPWVRYGMGRIYTHWKGMTDLARTEFDAVLKRDPKFYPAIIGLGDIARVKQDYEAAEQKYRAALAIAEDPFARAGLGLSLAGQGKNDEARVELRKAIKAQPEQPQALTMLVKLSQEVKDPETVLAAQALAELRPKDREARKMLADLRFEAGDKATAAKEYDRLVRLGSPELPVLQRLAGLYKELNEVEGEERILQTIAAADDKNPEANLRIAELRFARKDFEGAEGQWLEALVRDPKRVEAREAIAKMRLEAGVLHEALEEFRKALAIDPTRADSLAAATKLETDFKLPKKKAKGAPTNVYWAVQASLGKFFDERKLANRALAGKYKIRVRISKEGIVEGVDVLEDGLKDPLLLGHVYFGLRDAEFSKQKGEPVFDFELGAKKKK
jgi:Tfp pilus assembly protein PilF